jgi:hypothetical protein
LKEEPPADHPHSIRTIIKLPNGTRLERRFLSTDSLSVLNFFILINSKIIGVILYTAFVPVRIQPQRRSKSIRHCHKLSKAQPSLQNLQK